jgi:5-(aminomethyl)-3-furanmethanol phosphate kinase
MCQKSELTVLKLGGSYALTDQLQGWLEVIARAAGRVVVVPGGGPFANVVKAAQLQMKFDDCAAHHMALLAMAQYGCAIASLHSGFVLAQSANEIKAGLQSARVPVWSPIPMALAAHELPASWEVSSDSLAVWLAERLCARRVVLIKRIDLSCGQAPIVDLVRRGVVDPFLPRLLSKSTLETYIVGPKHHAALAAAMRNGLEAGIRVTA